MAATSDKYSIDTLNDRDTVVGTSTTKNIYAYMPLALTEYVSDQNFKEQFYLHDVIHKVDSEDKECVLGLVQNDATTNFYKLHAAARRGKLHIVKNGVNYIILNDGGLNTMAYCYFSNTSPNYIYTNYVKVICYLRSAYYTQTDRFWIKILKNGSEVYSFPLIYDPSAMDAGVFPPKFAANAWVGKYNLGEIQGLSAGDIVTLQIVSENAEGTYTGVEKTGVSVLGAMNFVLTYRRRETTDNNGKGEPSWTDTSADPTDPSNYDERWAILISDDMYAYSGGSSGQVATGGTLGILFHTQEGDFAPNFTQSSEWLQGAQLQSTETIDDAYDKTLAAIGDGWYYGIPKEGVDGTTPTWVYVDTVSALAKRMYWHGDVYVPNNYSLKLSFTGSRDRTTGVYTVILKGTFTGSVQANTSITINIYPEISVIPEETPTTITATIGTAGEHTLYTFTTSNSSAMYMTYHTYGLPAPTNTGDDGFLNRADEATVRVSELPVA